MDLLKEFGDSKYYRQGGVSPEPALTAIQDDQDNDDFGDFAEPDFSVIDPQKYPSPDAQSGVFSKELNTSFSNDTNLITSFPQSEVQGLGGYYNAKKAEESKGSSVFFDAEEVIANTSTKGVGARGVAPQKSGKEPAKTSAKPVKSVAGSYTAEQGRFDQEDDWNPVELPQEPLVPENGATARGAVAVSAETSTSGVASSHAHIGPPPTNIPPPSVLLPVVSGIFRSSLNGIATDIKSGDTPASTLAFARAGARIIAGRKLRWKRDALLSQSMKIGPAGKPGGMKLTGIDKTENLREDQEAAEAIAIWRKQIGQVRSAVSKSSANNATAGMSVPDISETMPIRVIKPSEGAVFDTRCCCLCGLKREERVAKVDVHVEDSFDEFWIEFWGHHDCVRLWHHIKGSLKQR